MTMIMNYIVSSGLTTLQFIWNILQLGVHMEIMKLYIWLLTVTVTTIAKYIKHRLQDRRERETTHRLPYD